MMGQLPPDRRKLLKQVLGARFSADGTLRLPLRTRFKTFGRFEILNVFALLGLGYWFLPELLRGGMSGVLTFGDYVGGVFVIQACVVLNLILPRSLIFRSNSHVAFLRQGRRTFPVSVAEDRQEVPGQPDALSVDGGEFRTTPRILAARPAIDMAMATLREWLHQNREESGAGHGRGEVGRGLGAYLALLDVVSVGSNELRFRSALNRGPVFVAYGACLLLVMFFPMLENATSRLPVAVSDLLILCVWSLSALWAVLFRVLQPRVTAVAGAGVRVRLTFGKISSPPWNCRFATKNVNTTSDEPEDQCPAFILRYGECGMVLASSQRHTEAQLGAFAARMNAFIWGSGQQPTAPSLEPPNGDLRISGPSRSRSG